MTTQLLIYKTAVPVSRARHANWFVETKPNYAFSGEINSVPLMAVEFPQAASEYAIVFAGTEHGNPAGGDPGRARQRKPVSRP